MEVNSKVEIVTMFCNCYLSQIFVGLAALLMLKIIYFYIKRRYTQTTIVDKISTEDNDINTNSENVLNESSSETLNLGSEKKSELLKCIDTEDHLDNKIHNDLLNFDTTLIRKKTMDIKNVTVCSGYGSTEDEMHESKNYSTSQDVLDTCKLNSDSHSTIHSWESCNNEISHFESDYVSSLSSENPEICQPLNLSMKDEKNETDTHKTAKTFFTDRKYKSKNDTLDIDFLNNLYGELVDDDDESVLKLWNKLKNEFDILKNTKIHSSCYEKIKNSNCFFNKEASLNKDKIENYILDDTKDELKNENTMEITKLSSIHHYELEDEVSFDKTKHFLNDDELMLENNLETTGLSPINQVELDYKYNLESPQLSSLNNDKSISGIDSPDIKCTHDYYEVQGITEFNSTSSSECTESLPSPIFNNDSSIDDIQYVEDYNDISFFDPKLSDDALNEAFVED